MESSRFDRFTRTLGTVTGRRTLLQGLAAGGAAVFGRAVLPDEVMAKALCLKNGSRCRKKGKRCKAGNCLQTPFTIEARWSNNATDQDTYLFVPNAGGATLPSPYIDYSCVSASTNAGALYPFAFTSGDATGPGDEVTTVKKLLAGKYEYWIELYGPSPAGDLTVTLRNPNGRVVRTWSSPENTSNLVQKGWHVFDIQGGAKSITSIDELIAGDVPGGAHNSNTDVCP